MSPSLIHILGIDPGGTTGFALLTVSRQAVFGDQPGAITEFDYGEITGDENEQVLAIARKSREIQNLDYQVGPAIIIEDFDVDKVRTTDAEVLFSPVRIAAKMGMVRYMGKLFGDATLTLQSRAMAKSTATDERLKTWGLYDAHSGDHARDAMRHAVTALRRAASKPEFRAALWPYLGSQY